MHGPSRTLVRRGLAAAMSGTLVAGVVAAAGKVFVGGVALRWQKMHFGLTTKSEGRLTPGKTRSRQRVRVELTMPQKLQRAVQALRVTHARGGPPNSGVKIRMPVSRP